MADVVLPPLPAENENPWFSRRNAFDQAVKTQLEGPLSESGLNATIAEPGSSVTLRSPTSPTADTRRLRIVSFQKQESKNQFNGGESIWLDVNQRGKAMLTWRLPMNPADPRRVLPEGTAITDAHWTRIVWAGAHWFAQDKSSGDTDPATSIHGHWSVEVPDVDMSLRTRFQIFFNDQSSGGDPTIIGTSAALISTSRADFAVEGGMGLDGVTRFGRFIVRAPAAYDKMVEFQKSGDERIRWMVGANNTGESGTGGATGADFEIRNFDDDGILKSTALGIRRLDGSAVFGSKSWQPSNDAARVTVEHDSATSSGFMVRPSVEMTGTRAAAFKARLTTPEEMLISARVATDDQHRFGIRAGGQIEWSASGGTPDIIMSRVAPGRLSLNGELSLGSNLRIGGMTVGASAGIVGLANTSTVSESNPTGGLWMWSAAGVLNVRSAYGYTITLGQQSAVANATDAASAITQLNAALAALRTIGLIAS